MEAEKQLYYLVFWENFPYVLVEFLVSEKWLSYPKFLGSIQAQCEKILCLADSLSPKNTIKLSWFVTLRKILNVFLKAI